jgi:hypothetical protein
MLAPNVELPAGPAKNWLDDRFGPDQPVAGRWR